MTYLYFCPIHKEFEVEHKITESLTYCPKCKEENVETEVKRLIVSEGGFILNGGGWAKDNYS